MFWENKTKEIMINVISKLLYFMVILILTLSIYFDSSQSVHKSKGEDEDGPIPGGRTDRILCIKVGTIRNWTKIAQKIPTFSWFRQRNTVICCEFWIKIF